MSEISNRKNIEIEDDIRGDRAKKLEGKTFYWLTGVKYLGRAFYRGQMQGVYHFKCKCGKELVEYSREVREGRVKSCGCYQPKRVIGKDYRHKMWNNFWEGGLK